MANIIINKVHCTLGFVFGYDVEAMKKQELENFVSENIRQVSPKTGKPIKVNTFKWKVAELRELVSNYLDACYNMCKE